MEHIYTDTMALAEKCTKKPLESVERIRNRTKNKQIERVEVGGRAGRERPLLTLGKDKK